MTEVWVPVISIKAREKFPYRTFRCGAAVIIFCCMFIMSAAQFYLSPVICSYLARYSCCYFVVVRYPFFFLPAVSDGIYLIIFDNC